MLMGRGRIRVDDKSSFEKGGLEGQRPSKPPFSDTFLGGNRLAIANTKATAL